MQFNEQMQSKQDNVETNHAKSCFKNNPQLANKIQFNLYMQWAHWETELCTMLLLSMLSLSMFVLSNGVCAVRNNIDINMHNQMQCTDM